MTSKDISKKWGIPAGCVLGLLFLLALYLMFLHPTFSIQETAYLYVDHDDTPDSVAAKIKSTGHPGIAAGFPVLSAIGGYTVKSGRYAIRPEDHMLSLYRRLRQGRQAPVRLTIPTARTMDRLAGTLSKKLMLDSATVARSLADSAFCHRYGYDTATIACLFIPNTYEVYWNIGLDPFMQRMQKEYKTFWNQERLDKAKAAGLTPEEVATLASIVDEETANNAEKPAVAGMYVNRLRRGMPLQADPTIKFALRDFSLRRIYHGHLEVESPYNTYRNPGLPLSPIRIASIAGIEAVLNYTRHDFLYMCAKEDFSGTHNFARTYQEHLANAAKYSAALNRRGIK